MKAGTNLIIKMKQDMPGLISTMNYHLHQKELIFLFCLYI